MKFIKKRINIEHLIHLTIYILIIAVNVYCYYLRIHVFSQTLWSDEEYYLAIAEAITKGSSVINVSFLEHQADIGYSEMPGYALFIAIFYFIFQNFKLTFYITQTLLSVLAILLYQKICMKYFQKWIAYLSTGFLILYLNIWIFNFRYLTESFTISLGIIIFYFLHQYLITKKLKYFYFYVCLFGTLIVINNRFVFHFVICFLFMMLYEIFTTKLLIKKYLISAGIITIMLLPWHIRQYKVYNRFVVFGPERTKQVKGDQFNWHFKSYEEYKKDLKEKDRPKFTRKKFEELKKNYTAFHGFHKYTSRLFGFWDTIDLDFRFGYGGDIRLTAPRFSFKDTFILTPMLYLFFLGLFYSISRKNFLFMIINVYIISHILLHVYVHYIHRYRYQVLALIFLSTWYGINELIIDIKKRRYRRINFLNGKSLNHNGSILNIG